MGEWGLIMRTEAQYASNEDIVEEYEELRPQVEKLVRSLKDQQDIGIVNQRYFSSIYLFTQRNQGSLGRDPQ